MNQKAENRGKWENEKIRRECFENEDVIRKKKEIKLGEREREEKEN